MTNEIEIELEDMDAWENFAADNEEALVEAYGSVANALKHCCDGGLTLGGGASPEVIVWFAA